MKIFELRRICIFFLLSAVLLASTSCDDDFYLSENEAKAYESIFISQTVLNQHFDNLQGQEITLTFNNSSGTPKLQSTDLLAEMRRTELANLETGASSVVLDRLSSELETQIGKWIEGRLKLYTNGNIGDEVLLNELTTVRVIFLNNPGFTYLPDEQAIDFNVNLSLKIRGEIEVNAVNWLINIFTSINGTYPLEISMPDLRLQGKAKVFSPYSNAGRIRFQLMPQIITPIEVLENGTSIPNAVKQGAEQVLTKSLSQNIDEVFLQEYDHFALSQIRMTPQIAQNASRLEISYRSKADWLGPDSARPQMHVVSRASDGKLYHARKSNAEWTEYLPVPMPSPSSTPYPNIENDPTLIHSGKGQLELAATNQAGDLVYTHWRDEKWGNTQIITPNITYNPAISYVGKPAVSATAPGQAEIIVAGNEGNLWHLRRKNGVWHSPFKIPLTSYANLSRSFRDPMCVYVGNKIIVVFADGNARLFAIAYDLETEIWGQPAIFKDASNSNVTIQYAPALVASGENRIDVVYAKQGGFVFHRILHIDKTNFMPGVGSTGISFSNNETDLSGKTNATPILTASTFHQPELIMRGLDNYLYHNHFTNASSQYTVNGQTVYPGWQDWKLLDKFLFSSKAKRDGKFAEFSAAGTRTSKIEVVGRAKPKYSYQSNIILNNEFESERYGRATTPWKAVHWRGWDSTETQQFYGRPALATVDSNFQTVNIGRRDGFGETVHTQRLGGTNQTYLLGLTSVVKTANSLTDPVVLSSGTGMFDTIALLKNGLPQHTRFYSNGSTLSKQLTVPAGVILENFSATSYGNGYIDLAANASDQRIYFWRFRNGNWSSPIDIANQIISAPILNHVGAGQLELLAVGVDHNLIRYQFVNNAWQSPINVPHNFSIDEKRFSPNSASSWGDGTVDLVVVERDTYKLYQRRIGPGVWNCTNPIVCPVPRQFQNIGGSSLETPILTAFSPTDINVLSMPGLRWYSSWSSKIPLQPFPAPRDVAIRWSGHKYIGGDEMLVGGTATTGRNNFVAIAVQEGQFYINRNINGNWTGFQSIIGQDPKQILKQPIFLPSITSNSN